MSLPAENLKEIGPVSHLPTVPAPMDIVRAALATGNIEMYREAVSLAKEMDAIASRKAFDVAMADAQAELPTIRKNREVDSGGRGPKYRFEDLAEIERTVKPVLSKHGLNYRFRTQQEGDRISITCIVSHRAGHSEENTLTAGPDNGPGRNAIQQIGSTQTYLQRYTLKAALGLAASQDDDGHGSEQKEAEPYTPPPGSITDEQAANIREALEDKGASQAAFLQWAAGKGHFAGRKQLIAELPADRYDTCMTAIAGFKKG
jgi:hypothetical protein